MKVFSSRENLSDGRALVYRVKELIQLKRIQLFTSPRTFSKQADRENQLKLLIQYKLTPWKLKFNGKYVN